MIIAYQVSSILVTNYGHSSAHKLRRQPTNQPVKQSPEDSYTALQTSFAEVLLNHLSRGIYCNSYLKIK